MNHLGLAVSPRKVSPPATKHLHMSHNYGGNDEFLLLCYSSTSLETFHQAIANITVTNPTVVSLLFVRMAGLRPKIANGYTYVSRSTPIGSCTNSFLGVEGGLVIDSSRLSGGEDADPPVSAVWWTDRLACWLLINSVSSGVSLVMFVFSSNPARPLS